MTTMLLRRFHDDKLAQSSWMIGCQATGEAVVVDPNRSIEQYLEAARGDGFEIVHVTETHIHADFVSGVRELAGRTGATMYLSDEGGADWRYGFLADGRGVRLRDGDVFMVGNVKIRAVHTPGHTPEHLCFLVTDTLGADEPMGAFTGDFLFVGDVGRPDLLEKAAGVGGTMEASARQLFASLQTFRELPDWLQIWPGHGAGSACGKSLGAVPQSTLGYEKRFNWAFGLDDEQAFVDAVLAGQPEPPKYFAHMKRINRDGPPVLGRLGRPARISEDGLDTVLKEGGIVIDTRRAAAFGEGHVPGTLNIPLNRSFTTWAGWLIPYDRDFHLLVDEMHVDEATRDLMLIGLDRVAGWFAPESVNAWAASGRPLERLASTDTDSLAAGMGRGDVAVIDVRGRTEWEAGHLPGVPNIPLGFLADRLDEVPRDRPVVLQCRTGSRSAIAASLLQLHGIRDASNLMGGFVEWARSGRPVEKETAVGVQR
jgi:hydroxyacylglutathione hydrolase